MAEDQGFDLVKVRAVVLGIATVWMTVDDCQKEVTALRERNGEKPAHVPIQLVQQVLSQLVEQGSMVERKEQGKPLAYRLNRQALISRRAKVLEHLCFEGDQAELVGKVLDRTGATPGDIEELLTQGLIARRGEGELSLLVLGAKVSVDVVQKGAEIVVGSRIPRDADDKEVGDDFARKAVQAAEAATEAKKKAELHFNRLRLWLASNGIVDIEGIIEPPPARPTRTVFEHTETRKVDDVERGRILTEVLKLEEAKALVQLRLDGAKTQGKADHEKLDAEIAALKSAAQSSERVIATMAFKEIDWAANAVVIRANDDGRELARTPIPKGAQKPIPGTEAEKTNGIAKGEPPASAAEPGDSRPKVEELRLVVIDVLKTSPGLTPEEIAKRITESYSNVPEGLEGLLKIQIHQLVKGKDLSRDKKTGALTLLAAPPAEPPNGAAPAEQPTDGEPGPLADPERRKRGSKKKDDSAEASLGGGE